MSETMIETANVFHLLRAERIDSADQLFGMSDRWLAPISMFDIRRGFNESVWVAENPVSLLAMRLSGAPVTCRWGRHNGRSTRQRGVTFQPRGTPNDFSADSQIRFTQLYLSETLIERVAGEIWSARSAQERLREDLIFLSDPVLEQLYVDYLDAALHQSGPLELEARAILIVSRLLRAHHGAEAGKSARAGGLAPWQLKRACDAMETHIDRDISLEALARIAGVSATHFSRAFKQSMGVPPFAWLQQRRIARAKELLSHPDLSLAEIALATGFAAQPQFTTAFRREVGMPPGAWRRTKRL